MAMSAQVRHSVSFRGISAPYKSRGEPNREKEELQSFALIRKIELDRRNMEFSPLDESMETKATNSGQHTYLWPYAS